MNVMTMALHSNGSRSAYNEKILSGAQFQTMGVITWYKLPNHMYDQQTKRYIMFRTATGYIIPIRRVVCI